MREEDVATEIANALSECVNACATIVGEMWQDQRSSVLDAVSWFVEAAPLVDRPDVRGDIDMIRRIRAAGIVAVKLQPAVIAWDGTTAPPPPLVSLARELLAAIGIPAPPVPDPGTVDD
jgi:hypothetical protein